MNLRTVDGEFYHRTATCAGSMTPDMPAAMDLLRLAVEGIAKVSELGPKVFPKNDNRPTPCRIVRLLKKEPATATQGEVPPIFQGANCHTPVADRYTSRPLHLISKRLCPRLGEMRTTVKCLFDAVFLTAQNLRATKAAVESSVHPGPDSCVVRWSWVL
jgi:hypothetical protein